ncbi:MAG: PAS domain-containing sensor histidine kinase [Promethearchaeota archaeon]|nr:MAG: PAS domain-containing sensor histidine kinase [Candidatus Lokiarchaeota archaeon]
MEHLIYSFVNSSTDLIFLKDENLEYVLINDAYKEFIGRKKDEIIGKTDKDLLPPILAQQCIITDKKALECGEITAIEKNENQIFEVRKFRVKINGDKVGIGGIIRDITGHKKIENELRKRKEELSKSREKYKKLTEKAPVGILTCDKKGVIQYLNEQMLRILGSPSKELTRKIDLLHFPLLKKAGFSKKLKNVLETGKIEKAEIKYKSKWGKSIWARVHFSPLMEKGSINGAQIIADDISMLKKAENALKKSEENQRILLSNIQTQVWYLTDDETYASVNKAHALFNGMKKEELEFKNIFNIYPKEVAQICQEGNKEVFKTRKTIFTEEWVPNGSGELRLLEITKVPKLREDGSVEYIVCSAEDITARKQAQNALKESEKKFSTTFNSSPIGVAITTSDGKFIDLNDKCCETIGYSRDELIGKHFLDLKIINSIDLDNIKKKIQLNNGILRNTEVTIQKEEDGEKTILLSIGTIKLQGIKHYLCTFVDISERKREMEKLEKLNRLKSELISMTSHELKTPLVSIKGYADLILELYSEDLAQDIKDMISEICNGCMRLESRIEDILNTSKLETEKVQINKQKLNLSNLLTQVVNSIGELAYARNQSIQLDIQERLFTRGDSHKLFEVIENLLSNAVKYTPTGGKILIKTKLHDDNIIVMVKDNGIGFTEEEKKALFTQFGKFERNSEGLEIDSQGSGLGLYISKKIIKLHDGKIWMESEGRNKGSTFFFSLLKAE